MLESAKVGQALRSALPSRVAPPAARRHITPPEPHAHVHRRCARPQVWRPRRPLVCERAHWHRDPGSTTSSRRPRSEHQQVASRSPLLACACPPSRACQALCSLVCLGTGQLTRAVLCIAGFAVASVTVASVRRPPLRLLPRRCLGLETVALVMVALVRRPLLPCSSLAQSPPRPRTDLLLYALRYRIRREALELQGRPRRDRVRPQSCCLGGGHSAGELGSRSRRLSPLSVPTSPCVHCLRTAPCRGA